MKGPKNRHAGKILVALILVAGVALALTTRQHYTSQRPASTEARLMDNRLVLAKFPPEAAAILRNGMKATISIAGKRHTGILTGTDLTREHTYLITLDPTPPTPAAGVECKVIVDTTVPPELLKSQPR